MEQLEHQLDGQNRSEKRVVQIARSKRKRRARDGGKTFKTGETYFSNFYGINILRLICLKIFRGCKKISSLIVKALCKTFSSMMLIATFLVGCAESDLPLQKVYEFKQIRNENVSSYLVCRGCVDYTKINKNQQKEMKAMKVCC